MAAREYVTVARPDNAIVSAFKKMDAALGGTGQSNLTLMIIEGASPISATLESIESNSEVTAHFAHKTAVSQWLELRLNHLGKVMIRVTRQQDLDQVRIQVPDGTDGAVVASIVTAVHSQFPGFEASGTVKKILGTELQEFYARREASLTRLEELSQTLIEQNTKYRETLDEQFVTEKSTLQAAQAEYFEKVQKEFEGKEGELNKRGEELTARAKELDDRASRHVRRQIRKEFLEKLASREKQFNLSASTNSKRLAIHAQFWVFVVFSLFIAYGGYQAVIADAKEPYAYIRLVLGVIGFAATTIYYIRWTDVWFRQHADEEFRLQRLALDFDRASWVVEMALEWQQEKGEAIPHELVDRLTANLFVSGASSEATRHPAEDLAAALLGASSNLKLNLPGGAGELNLDRKSIKNLSD